MKKIFYSIILLFFTFFSSILPIKGEEYNQNPEAIFLRCYDGGIRFESKWSNIPPELGHPSDFLGYIWLKNSNTETVSEKIPLYFRHVYDNVDGVETYYWYNYFEYPKGMGHDVELGGGINGRKFSNAVSLQCNLNFLPNMSNN